MDDLDNHRYTQQLRIPALGNTLFVTQTSTNEAGTVITAWFAYTILFKMPLHAIYSPKVYLQGQRADTYVQDFLRSLPE